MSQAKQYNNIEYFVHDYERKAFDEEIAEGEERSPFERDRSRIIHSSAFRRLQGKTQVFTAGEGDFFRTRLTHSLEVAQIGKGLALRLGADPDLVEAVCLLHDIGHPPFGHTGEQELKALMGEYGGFEANAQNIRILMKLEVKSTNYTGLNLTRAVLDGQLKYKSPFAKNREKFIYAEDLELVSWGGKEARQSVGELDESSKSFECQIMDWADDIAYAVHDLEDSIHARYIDASVFKDYDSARLRRVKDNIKAKTLLKPEEVNSIFEELILRITSSNPDLNINSLPCSEQQQKAYRKQLTSHLIHTYINAASRKDKSPQVKDQISNRYRYDVHIPEERRVEVDLMKRLVWEFVIESPQVCILENRARYIIRSLFDRFMQESVGEKLLPMDWRERFDENPTICGRARVVSDYISGMTDDYAQKTYAKLFLPNQGSIYEVL